VHFIRFAALLAPGRGLVMILALVSSFAGTTVRGGCVSDRLKPVEKSIRRNEEREARNLRYATSQARKRVVIEQGLAERRETVHRAIAISGSKKPLSPGEYEILAEAEKYLDQDGRTAERDQVRKRMAPEKERRERLSAERARQRLGRERAAAKAAGKAIPENVSVSPQAAKILERMEADGNLAKRARNCRDAIAQIAKDPRYPGLRTKKLLTTDSYGGINNSRGDVFQSYAENNVAGAYRIFWHYKPDGKIEILGVSPHP
jgi:hypothetical protein